MTKTLMRAWLAALAACALAPPAGAQTPPPGDTGALARGEYLARIGGCASCHTMPRDGIPFAGGRPMSTPMGPIISTNITPDPVHGIGRYSFDDFRRVMREGTAPGNKHLYPAMPYTAYTKASDEDLQALFGYLMHAVPASDYAPPPTKLVFPFDQRWALRFWKAAFLPSGRYEAKAGNDAEWNRGAYLVQSFGHCGSCHTPRGVAYQERGYDESSRRFLTGMVNDDWHATNLTGTQGAGLGRSSAASIARFLRTGHADGKAAFGSMAEEVEQSLQYITEADARAVAGYLKSLPAQRNEGAYAPDRADTVHAHAEAGRPHRRRGIGRRARVPLVLRAVSPAGRQGRGGHLPSPGRQCVGVERRRDLADPAGRAGRPRPAHGHRAGAADDAGVRRHADGRADGAGADLCARHVGQHRAPGHHQRRHGAQGQVEMSCAPPWSTRGRRHAGTTDPDHARAPALNGPRRSSSAP
jgi:mono/diheme cytochrome c family protein